MTKLLLIAGLLLVIGIVFAPSRLKRAFKLGAALYAVVVVVRFAIFGLGDRDNLTDLLTIVSVFFLIWLIAWGATQFLLRHRARPGQSPPQPTRRRRTWR